MYAASAITGVADLAEPGTCRHGARTPLTLQYWDGAEWGKDSLCGQQFSAVQLSLSAMGGGPRPSSVHDKRQVCTESFE